MVSLFEFFLNFYKSFINSFVFLFYIILIFNWNDLHDINIYDITLVKTINKKYIKGLK